MTSQTAGHVQFGARGTYVRCCILLLLAEGATHGYKLLDQMPAHGFGSVDEGGLYRALRRMEEEGLVRSFWEDEHPGPARRVYAVTDDGLAWLHESAGAVRDIHRRLHMFLQHYRNVARDAPAQPA